MNRDFAKRASVMMGALLMVALSAHAGVVKHYDHRAEESDDGGGYIVFLSLPDSEGSVAGDAFTLLGRGAYPDEFKADASFGMSFVEGAPVLGTVSKAHGAAVRDDERTIAFVVQIDSGQYDEARALFEEWAKKDSFLDEPDIEALNFCEILVKRLEMKKPFRPMLSRANPHVYFDDVSKLNRDK